MMIGIASAKPPSNLPQAIATAQFHCPTAAARLHPLYREFKPPLTLADYSQLEPGDRANTMGNGCDFVAAPCAPDLPFDIWHSIYYGDSPQPIPPEPLKRL